MGDIYGAINVVLQTLGALVSAEVSSHSDLRNDVIAIQNELQNILGYLMNAEERAEGNDAAKDWVSRVRVLAYDIEDAIERYQLYLKKGYFSMVKLYILREVSSMASTIKSLREKATSIAGTRERFRFTTTNVIAQGQCNNQDIVTTSMFQRTIKSGNEVVIDAIAKREIIDLIGFQNVTGAPSTTAVIGMRGLGKTTVVYSVYYDDTIRSHFPLRAWISMSECRQQVAILRSMIAQFSHATNKLYGTDIVNMEERLLIDRLQSYIQRERFMVVFDNVQEGDIRLTTYVKSLLSFNERGSKIIVTTRYKDVARAWLDGTTTGMYMLKPLPFEKAWELFCKKAFQSSHGNCPPQLTKLARGIVKKCGGLPPVIVSVRSLLCTKGDDLNDWNKVRHSLGFYLDINRQLSGIHKTFMRSYYELPFYIKPCFLYFGLFPRGYPISRMRLIRLWMAEGFIRESRERLTLEEVAEEYINELINMSMIDVISQDSSGKIKTLGVVNKFIHEMILSKLDELSFCKILSRKGFFGKETSRRLSIYKNSKFNAPELANLRKTSSSIRSLFIEDVEQIIMVNVFDKTFLQSIELLKVLDLFNAPIDSIPAEVGTLLNLHYLSLRSTQVSRIPKTIGKLEKLQTLDLKQTLISELPNELIQLHNLRHILGYYYAHDIFLNAQCMNINGVKIPKGLLENCLQLQKLAFLNLNAGHRNWERELRKLTQLRKLGITGLKTNEGRAICSVIDAMNNLQAFSIFSKSKTESIDLTDVTTPPPMLQRVYVSGPLLSFPTWILQLHSLVKIRLRWSKLKDDPLQMLQELRNLVELQLLEAFIGEHLKIASHGFQKLKILNLLDLHPLRSLFIAKGALPVLDKMSIGESKNLKVPSSIKYLSTLTTLNFYNMPSYFTDHILPGSYDPRFNHAIRSYHSIFAPKYNPGLDKLGKEEVTINHQSRTQVYVTRLKGMSDIYGPLQIVLQLLPLVQSKVSMFSDLKDDVDAIKMEWHNILGYLTNAEEIAEGNDAAKAWVKKVRQFAFDIEDAIEWYQLLLNGRKRDKFKQYISGDIRSMASTINSLRGIASGIARAGDRFSSITDNGTQHGQFNNQVTSTTTLNNCTMTSGYEVVVDETAKGEIVDLLGFQNVTRTPSTVAVVGMRGLGKTTVVENIYYDPTIKTQFPLRAWISMSKCRQQDSIISSMIVQFSSATNNKIVVDGMAKKSLLPQLQNYIEGKRYMVVFDDVRQKDTDLTKHIRGLLDTNKEKSKIIITTRNENVAHAWLKGISNGLYKLKPLPSDKAWELFLKKTFQGSGERCPSTLHDLASGIVEKCGGVPPVINAVGDLLCNKGEDLSDWSKVHQNFGFYLSKRQLSVTYRDLMQIYYDLPFDLRPCFLYFGLFPENYPIGRNRLIRLWISEGFISERTSFTLEEVAEDCIDDLISMSMVEVKSRDPSGKVRTLGVVSKFLHELILSKLDELSFCKILSPKGSFGNEKSRRLSIYKNHESHALELDNITKNPPSIRSLFSEDVAQPIMVKVLDNKFLESINLLRVLDLINAPINSIPKEVGKLLNLRYLSLRGTRVSRIPKTIGNLENLLTLDLKHTLITELPKKFNKLHNLRHLLGYYYDYNMLYDTHCKKIHGVKIPGGLLGKCLKLQKLAFLDLNAGHRNWVTELSNLTQLRKLGIIGLKWYEGNAMSTLIDGMKHLQALNILSESKSESIDLRNVKYPPQMLKRFYLSGSLPSIPTWICQLTSLVKIRLRWSNLPIDPLVSLALLPNLAELQLLEAFTGKHLKITSPGFQKLKVLHLLNLYPLKSLSIAEGALPILSELSIGESKNLEVPSDIKHLHGLQTLNFYDMPAHFTDQIRSGKPCFYIIKHVPSIFLRNKHPTGWQTETI